MAHPRHDRPSAMSRYDGIYPVVLLFLVVFSLLLALSGVWEAEFIYWWKRPGPSVGGPVPWIMSGPPLNRSIHR